MATEIRRHADFLVLGHVEPDGDCIASQLVLSSLLGRMGKRAVLVNEGPFERPEIKTYETLFHRSLPAAAEIRGAVAVFVDCSTPERIGDLAGGVAGHPTIVIDHHATGSVFGDVRYVEPGRASVTLMLLDVMDALGLEPEPDEAELILFGLCTDTAFFRHLEAGSAEVFRAAARLVSRGVAPSALYQRIYGGRSLEERRLLGLTLSRTESHAGGAILLCHQALDERSGGSEEIYRLLQTVAGVRVVVLLREDASGVYSVSLRSTGELDVGAVAGSLGGGGHRNAAGCTMRGTLETLRAHLLEVLAPLVLPSLPPGPQV